MYNLPLLSLQQMSVRPDYSPYDPEIQAGLTALKLYQRTRFWGCLRRAWSVLTRRSHDLLSLSQVKTAAAIHKGYTAGVKVVPIRQIRGSEGHAADFDRAFSPLQERNRWRWLSIAAARLQGAALPPVVLLQIGDVYYVRDGHHRISVARALGQDCVEADVTVWALAEQPALNCCPQLKPACAA